VNRTINVLDFEPVGEAFKFLPYNHQVYRQQEWYFIL